MKTKITLASIGASLLLPLLSFAQVYSTTTAAAEWNSSAADIGYMIGLSLVAVLGGAAALIGLGFGWRHLKKYITGRKF